MSSNNGDRVDTGIKRLDDLLAGGLPVGTSTLLYGPPFAGKQVLASTFLVAGLRRGMPAVVVLTDASSADARAQFAAMDPEYPRYEKAGLVAYVDAYSRSIGAEDDHEHTEYVDGPLNLNALSLAVNNAQRRLIVDHPRHRLLVDSVSTLMAYTNAQTAFRFLQVFLGKARRAGATSLLQMEAGMHTDAEVQCIKHLVDGVFALRSDNAKNLLHVEGVGVTDDRGWVEYRYSPGAFEITGSFSAGRIR